MTTNTDTTPTDLARDGVRRCIKLSQEKNDKDRHFYAKCQEELRSIPNESRSD